MTFGMLMLSLKCPFVKNFNYKNPRWKMEIVKSQYLMMMMMMMMMHNGSLVHIGHPPSWIFGIKFLTTVHLGDRFCVTVPNFMEIGYTVAQNIAM